MPRPPKCRWVEYLPQVTSFAPVGVVGTAIERIQLSVEELEAIRLKDLEQLEGEEAGERMGISRPTFQRLLDEAHRKVAEALVLGKSLSVRGGNYQVAMRQFRCTSCAHQWDVPFVSGQMGLDIRCPVCNSDRVHRLDKGGRGFGRCRRGCPGGRPWCPGRYIGERAIDEKEKALETPNDK
jgi:predicted DNA-binding protein (UPF0251 family)